MDVTIIVLTVPFCSRRSGRYLIDAVALGPVIQVEMSRKQHRGIGVGGIAGGGYRLPSICHIGIRRRIPGIECGNVGKNKGMGGRIVFQQALYPGLLCLIDAVNRFRAVCRGVIAVGNDEKGIAKME